MLDEPYQTGLIYLLHAYKPSLLSDLIETNTMLFSDVLNKDYDEYQNNPYLIHQKTAWC
ncbi:hypothetical protein [Salmonella enterica]|uniref:hypothetical protein n=1 Tax=Salmonella enterica TaxID=28901 RepID=UPI003A4D91AB